MKNLKLKLASVAIIASMSIAGAVAQPKPQAPQRGGAPKEQMSPEKMAEVKTDRMDQVLELSDAQEKKIYAINLKAAQAMGNRPTERPSREEMQAKMSEMKAQKDAYNKEIFAVLNDDQKMDYAMMVARAEVKRQMHHRKGAHNKQGKPQQGKKPQSCPQK